MGRVYFVSQDGTTRIRAHFRSGSREEVIVTHMLHFNYKGKYQLRERFHGDKQLLINIAMMRPPAPLKFITIFIPVLLGAQEEFLIFHSGFETDVVGEPFGD